jgi:hypothetical protein
MKKGPPIFGSGELFPPQYRTMSLFQNQNGFWCKYLLDLNFIAAGGIENKAAPQRWIHCIALHPEVFLCTCNECNAMQ